MFVPFNQYLPVFPTPAPGNHYSTIYIFLIWLFETPVVSDVIQYLSFSVLPVLFSIMPSRSIHVVAKGRLSFYC